MPPLFSSAYTPIAAAGTPAQVKHVSRLLATQIHAVGLGPGSTAPPSIKVNKILERDFVYQVQFGNSYYFAFSACGSDRGCRQ